jgi:hypothetical protein
MKTDESSIRRNAVSPVELMLSFCIYCHIWSLPLMKNLTQNLMPMTLMTMRAVTVNKLELVSKYLSQVIQDDTSLIQVFFYSLISSSSKLYLI